MTDRNIFPLKILNLSYTFKITSKIIVVLCLRFDHSVRCSFFNTMSMLEPVAAICRLSDSGREDDDGTQFICCVDEQQPESYEVWIFGEGGVTPEVHPTARVDVGVFVGDYFATNYITPTWRRVPMFGQKPINGIVEWLGVPSLLRNDGPSWTLNLLSPYADLGGRGSSTSKNLSSVSGGYSDSVFINWNWPARVLPIYHWRIFEITRSAARHSRNNILMENLMYRMQSLSTCCRPIRGLLFNQRDDTFDDRWDFLFVNNLCREFPLLVSVSVIFLSFLSLV